MPRVILKPLKNKDYISKSYKYSQRMSFQNANLIKKSTLQTQNQFQKSTRILLKSDK